MQWNWLCLQYNSYNKVPYGWFHDIKQTSVWWYNICVMFMKKIKVQLSCGLSVRSTWAYGVTGCLLSGAEDSVGLSSPQSTLTDGCISPPWDWRHNAWWVFKGKENGKTIMRASMNYTLYHWLMCMHWLKYVRLNGKDLLKNMCGTKLDSGALSAISGVYQCVTAWAPPTWAFFTLWMYLTLIGQQNINGAALGY